MPARARSRAGVSVPAGKSGKTDALILVRLFRVVELFFFWQYERLAGRRLQHEHFASLRPASQSKHGASKAELLGATSGSKSTRRWRVDHAMSFRHCDDRRPRTVSLRWRYNTR